MNRDEYESLLGQVQFRIPMHKVDEFLGLAIAEIADLRRQLAEAQEEVAFLRTDGYGYGDAIAHLRRQLAERDADAERYRWLRAQHWDSGQLAVVRNPNRAVKLGHDCPSLDRLDAAIDALRATEPEQTGCQHQAWVCVSEGRKCFDCGVMLPTITEPEQGGEA